VYVHPDELPLPPSGRIIGALARVHPASAGSSAGHKLTERVLNFFDYSRRAR
jgi:hypothetical protein